MKRVLLTAILLLGAGAFLCGCQSAPVSNPPPQSYDPHPNPQNNTTLSTPGGSGTMTSQPAH